MNTTTNTQASQLADQFAGEIVSLRAYLGRVGFTADQTDEAIAAAVAQVANRPDISNPLAYMTTFARGEAERLRAEAAAGEPDKVVPDLLAVLKTDREGTAKRRMPQQAPGRRPHRESVRD